MKIKKIEKPWTEGIKPVDIDTLHAWFDKYIEPLNELLANGVEVYHRHDGRETKVWCSLKNSYGVDDTHKALQKIEEQEQGGRGE